MMVQFSIRRLPLVLLLAPIFGVAPLVQAQTPPTTISVSDATQSFETDGGAGAIFFRVSLSAPSSQSTSVLFHVAEDPSAGIALATVGSGNCSAGEDFISAGDFFVTIPANTNTAPFTDVSVTICGDSIDEFDERFLVTISSPSPALTIADNQAVGLIIDDDPLPTLSIAGTTLLEGNAGQTNAGFAVTLNRASGKTVSAVPTLANGTATGGAACGGAVDFVNTALPVVTLNPGQTTGAVSVPVCGDVTFEANQTFTVSLTNPLNTTLGNSATGTITNDDTAPPVIASFTPTCGPVGTVVTITGTAFTGVTTVRFNATAATTFTVNSATQITATVPAGATTGPISVVSPGGTATSAGSFAVGVLPVVSITASDPTASEPGTDTGQFTLNRTGGTAAALTVNLAIATGAGRATPGADYVALAATSTIIAGSPTRTITVTPIDDTIDEDDQTVLLTVSPGACYTVGAPATATVTIQDNDPPPVLTITGRSVLETDGGSAVKLFGTVVLSARSEKTVSVNFATSTGTHTFVKPCVPLCTPTGICAICTFPCLPSALISSTATGGPDGSACGAAGIDFIHNSGTLTFPADTPSLTQFIAARLCGDSAIEPDDTFFVQLNSPTNATISNFGCGINDTAVATILNNDLNTGSFDLAPTDATVAVHDRLDYAFSWTVPDPLNWHDLQLLELRIVDDEGTALWVGFDEAGNTFSLFDEAKGEFGTGAAPGSNILLETPQATLYLDETSVVASSPTAPTVTLNLSLSFNPLAAGRLFLVEVTASDDQGNKPDFEQAGTLTVAPLNDDADDDVPPPGTPPPVVVPCGVAMIQPIVMVIVGLLCLRFAPRRSVRRRELGSEPMPLP